VSAATWASRPATPFPNGSCTAAEATDEAIESRWEMRSSSLLFSFSYDFWTLSAAVSSFLSALLEPSARFVSVWKALLVR
jgi:hypothetical protein